MLLTSLEALPFSSSNLLPGKRSIINLEARNPTTEIAPVSYPYSRSDRFASSQTYSAKVPLSDSLGVNKQLCHARFLIVSGSNPVPSISPKLGAHQRFECLLSPGNIAYKQNLWSHLPNMNTKAVGLVVKDWPSFALRVDVAHKGHGVARVKLALPVWKLNVAVWFAFQFH